MKTHQWKNLLMRNFSLIVKIMIRKEIMVTVVVMIIIIINRNVIIITIIIMMMLKIIAITF